MVRVTVAAVPNAFAGQLAVATPSGVLAVPAVGVGAGVGDGEGLGVGVVGGGEAGPMPPGPATGASTMLLSMLIVTPP